MGQGQEVSSLTVEELQTLIRRTVQEAMVEVLVEFTAAAEVEAEISRQAEIAEYLRFSLAERLLPAAIDELPVYELDD